MVTPLPCAGRSLAWTSPDREEQARRHLPAQRLHPHQALLHAGEIADQAREAAQFGVKATLDGIDIEGVHKYKDEVISGLYKGLQGLVASRKVTYIEGEGRLSSPTSVDVNGQRVQGRHILLRPAPCRSPCRA